MSQADKPDATRTQAFEFTTQRPVAILMTFVAIAVFGAVSYNLLPLSLMPDLTYPSLTVRTEYAGSAPQEVETAVSRPIEQELGVVTNLVRISSVSRAGLSDVTLDFAWGTRMTDATQEVREKLDQVFLPDDATRPLILRYDPQLDPVIRLGLHGSGDLYFLRQYGEEEVRRDLESLPGVAAVKVKGGLEEEIRVELDERRLATYGLDITNVGARLAAANVNLAGGNLEEGQTEYIVRTLNEFQGLDEIAEIVIASRQGAVVRVGDVGRVYRDHADRDVITRVNGEESVEINVFKEADANVVDVARVIRDHVFGTPAQRKFVATPAMQSEEPTASDAEARSARGRLQREMTDYLDARLPAGVSITLLSDQSKFIQNAIDEVRSTALWGGILAIVVLYVFLRRLVPTLIIAVAIPVSIVATFAPMYQFGVSLNIMSLGGLALGIGMLVDNSVVVLESITRCREEGDPLVRSVVRGAGEVGSAVIASTLTTVAVFAPIVFVEGVAGQVFGDLALTVVFSLLTSLIVALFLVPMLASRQVLAVADDAAAPENRRPWAARLQQLLTGPVRRVPVLMATATLAAFAVLLKGAVLLVACLLSPLWVWVFEPDRLSGWAERTTLGGSDLIQEVWSGLMSFTAPRNLQSTTRVEIDRWLSRSAGARAATAPMTLAALLWAYLLRTPLQVLLNTLGKAIIGLALAALVLGGGLVAALVGTLVAATNPLLKISDLILDGVRRTYPLVLRAALRRALGTATLLLIATAATLGFVLPRLGMELIPEVRQGIFDVHARLPVGTPLETTDRTLAPLEKIVRSHPGVEAVATTIGVDREEFDPDPEAGEHSGRFTVRLKPEISPILFEDDIVDTMRQQLQGKLNTVIKFSRPAMFSTRTPIEVEVRADELGTLRRVSEALTTRLAVLPELTDVKSSLQRGHPEIQVRYDRERLAHYALDIAQVAALVRNKVQGDVASQFRRGDRRVDIRVRVRPEDRATIADLQQLVVNPGQPNPIRLDSVAKLQLVEGPSEVRRIDQRRSVVVGANTTTDLASATAAIEAELRRVQVAGDYEFEITGQRAEMERSTRSLMLALSLAIFLVYVVMASQFESLVHPLVILFSIPLAAVGVVLTLWLLAVPLSVVVMLGCIMLAGIVVNNAIVLVDYINHLRRAGEDKIAAIVHAGEVRLRPILMTTCTTVIGLLPMAVGLGDGAEIRAPMAITVIAGLLTSTILTLVAVPVVYALLDRRP